MNAIKGSNAQTVPPAVTDGVIKNKGDNECKICTIYSTIMFRMTYLLYTYGSN